MKNNKWIRVTLTILLTLIVLASVAGAGFRMGVMQSARLVQSTDGTTLPPGHMRGFEQNFGKQQGYGPGMMFGQGSDQRMMQGFGRDGFTRGHGGFFSPIFGLVKLAVLGGLLWIVYKLVKNSGWKLTRESAAAQVASEVPSVDEKKE